MYFSLGQPFLGTRPKRTRAYFSLGQPQFRQPFLGTRPKRTIMYFSLGQPFLGTRPKRTIAYFSLGQPFLGTWPKRYSTVYRSILFGLATLFGYTAQEDYNVFFTRTTLFGSPP